jgi:chorismate mutase
MRSTYRDASGSPVHAVQLNRQRRKQVPSKNIDQRIAEKLAAQKKLSEDIAQLKRDQAKKERAKRQQAERQLGRLAVQCGLDQFTPDELRVVFQKAARELRENSQNEPHPSDPTPSDDKQAVHTVNSMT